MLFVFSKSFFSLDHKGHTEQLGTCSDFSSFVWNMAPVGCDPFLVALTMYDHLSNRRME